MSLLWGVLIFYGPLHSSKRNECFSFIIELFCGAPLNIRVRTKSNHYWILFENIRNCLFQVASRIFSTNCPSLNFFLKKPKKNFRGRSFFGTKSVLHLIRNFCLRMDSLIIDSSCCKLSASAFHDCFDVRPWFFKYYIKIV